LAGGEKTWKSRQNCGEKLHWQKGMQMNSGGGKLGIMDHF